MPYSPPTEKPLHHTDHQHQRGSQRAGAVAAGVRRQGSEGQRATGHHHHRGDHGLLATHPVAEPAEEVTADRTGKEADEIDGRRFHELGGVRPGREELAGEVHREGGVYQRDREQRDGPGQHRVGDGRVPGQLRAFADAGSERLTGLDRDRHQDQSDAREGQCHDAGPEAGRRPAGRAAPQRRPPTAAAPPRRGRAAGAAVDRLWPCRAIWPCRAPWALPRAPAVGAPGSSEIRPPQAGAAARTCGDPRHPSRRSPWWPAGCRGGQLERSGPLLRTVQGR